MKYRVMGIIAVLFCLVLSAGFSQNAALGMVVYLEGYVDVYRDGDQLDWEYVDMGLEIEHYDLMETGEDGQADVEITTPSSNGVVLNIKPNTAFYFDIGTVEKKQQTKFELLRGTIGLKVQRLTGNGEVVVNTPSAVLGVRGTEFMVTTAPEGSILVTTTEGQVNCKDDSGKEVIASIGHVVEKTSEGLRGIFVAADQLEKYRTNWIKEREQIFRAGAPVFIRFYATQFSQFYPHFADAFKELNKKAQIFQVWSQKRKEGQEITMGDLLMQRKDVSAAIFQMRRVFPFFEQVLYRLKVLKGFHDEGVGRTQIDRGLSSASFFADLGRAFPLLDRQMAQVRHFFKLYAWAGGGDDSLLNEIFESGPPKPTVPKGSDNF